MKQRLDESGIAYQIISIGFAFFVAAAMLLLFKPLLNFFVGIANEWAGGSSIFISAGTMQNFGFILGIFSLSPFIIIVGLLVGGYLEATYEKERAGGGML